MCFFKVFKTRLNFKIDVQEYFGAGNYLTILFHSENLLTVFKIPKTLDLSLI